MRKQLAGIKKGLESRASSFVTGKLDERVGPVLIH
jgi:hypothetical protein